MKNEYPFQKRIIRKIWGKSREKTIKTLGKTKKYIPIYLLLMPIFETSILGIHIAPTWYGLMYAFGFSICYIFLKKYGPLKSTHLDSLLTYVFFWILLGWRLWYVFLYNFEYFSQNPSEILAFWNGGMSFHWGFFGTLIAISLFVRRYKYSFFSITDILAVIVPVAIWLWRLWNWINQELPGYSPYSGPFAMNLNGVVHFPSPLLEMLLEGILLFIFLFLLWKYSNAKKYPWMLSGLFLVWYSIGRIISEQFRMPDAHIGYLLGTDWLTLGLIYTFPLLIAGIVIIAFSAKRK